MLDRHFALGLASLEGRLEGEAGDELTSALGDGAGTVVAAVLGADVDLRFHLILREFESGVGLLLLDQGA